MSLLGVILDSSGCRAGVYTPDGRLLAHARAAYARAPYPAAPQTLDVQAVWGAMVQAVAEVAGGTQSDPVRALCIGASGQALVPLSAEGYPLCDALLTPAEGESDCMRRVLQALGGERLGAQRLFDLTGDPPTAGGWLALLCWLREHQPSTYRATWRVASLAGLAALRLGGLPTCDHSLPGGSLLFDVSGRTWSREVLAAAGLSEERLPALAAAGTPLGTIAPGAARELGLPPRVRLVLGGRDLCCQALGVGAVETGSAMVALGTQGHLLAVFDAIPLTSLMFAHELPIGRHVVPGRMVSTWPHPSCGAMLRWFAEELAPLERREAARHGRNVYDLLLSEMPEMPTSLLALPPAESGQRATRFEGAVVGLGAHTTRGTFIKGLMEGSGYHWAVGLGALRQAGVVVERLRATGPGAHSAAWLQLLADQLGLPVERPRLLDDGTLGAALLAGVELGHYASARQAAAAVGVEHEYLPDPRRQAAYRQALSRYQALRELLATATSSAG